MVNTISEELIIEINSLAEEAIGESIVVGVDNKILEEGILDSPAIIKLIIFIEKKYKVTIEQDEMNIDSFSSINQIEKLIKSKIG
jgi:acyl carrier protein